MRRIIGCALVCAVLSSSPFASAQSASDKAAAEALFQQGKKLLEEGKFLEAAKKFQGSNRLDAGIGTVLYTADAFEKAGRLASAWASFREAQDLAQQAGQEKRQAIAKERADKLEPRLSKLTIEVGDNAKIEGFAVHRGSEKVNDAVFGSPTPLDTDSYELKASAPGYESWSQTVVLDKEGAVKTVTVPALVKKPEVVKKAPASAAPTTASAAMDGEATGMSTGYKATAISLTALGAVGLGVGTFFALDAKSTFDDASALCGPTSCSSQAASDETGKAVGKAHVATAAFAAGGAAAGAGILMFILAPSGQQDAGADSASLRWAPLFSSHGAGLSVGGSW